MDAELLNQFKAAHVKLVYRDGFTLTGFIVEVFDTSILFKTRQGESAISNDEIKTVMRLDGGGR